MLARILQARDRTLALIFTRTKRTAQKVADDLEDRGFAAAAIHGDLGQGAREQALRAFRSGKIDTLVATDVAARGLDVEGISHVVNYQAPEDAMTYVHRIGRTARAGKKGTSVTFVDWDDVPRWKLICDTLELPFHDPGRDVLDVGAPAGRPRHPRGRDGHPAPQGPHPRGTRRRADRGPGRARAAHEGRRRAARQQPRRDIAGRERTGRGPSGADQATGPQPQIAAGPGAVFPSTAQQPRVAPPAPRARVRPPTARPATARRAVVVGGAAADVVLRHRARRSPAPSRTAPHRPTELTNDGRARGPGCARERRSADALRSRAASGTARLRPGPRARRRGSRGHGGRRLEPRGDREHHADHGGEGATGSRADPARSHPVGAVATIRSRRDRRPGVARDRRGPRRAHRARPGRPHRCTDLVLHPHRSHPVHRGPARRGHGRGVRAGRQLRRGHRTRLGHRHAALDPDSRHGRDADPRPAAVPDVGAGHVRHAAGRRAAGPGIGGTGRPLVGRLRPGPGLRAEPLDVFPLRLCDHRRGRRPVRGPHPAELHRPPMRGVEVLRQGSAAAAAQRVRRP